MTVNPNALFCLAVPLMLLAPFAAGTVAQRVRARRRMDRLFAAGGAGSPVARITRGPHAGASPPPAPGGSRPARGNLSALPAGDEVPAAPRRAGAVEPEQGTPTLNRGEPTSLSLAGVTSRRHAPAGDSTHGGQR